MVIKKQDNPKKGEERGTHSPNRQDGDLRSDNKPDPAISHDVQSSADDKLADYTFNRTRPCFCLGPDSRWAAAPARLP